MIEPNFYPVLTLGHSLAGRSDHAEFYIDDIYTGSCTITEVRMSRKKAIIIGSGIGGLALGIRLQSLGFDTTIFEKLDAPGGRAYVRHVDGFTFDMGPTVITVPHFIEELFSLERDAAALAEPDFQRRCSTPTVGLLQESAVDRIHRSTSKSFPFCLSIAFTLMMEPISITMATLKIRADRFKR
jgi:monoamine oxidase